MSSDGNFRSETSFWISVLGGVTAGIPIVSLLLGNSDIQLSSLLNEFIDFYRSIPRAAGNVCLDLCGHTPLAKYCEIELSQDYLDGVTLSLIISMVFLRSGHLTTLCINKPSDRKNAPTDRGDNIFVAVLLIALAPTMIMSYLYAIVPFMALRYVFIWRAKRDSEEELFIRYLLLSFIATTVASVLFFAADEVFKIAD